MTTTHTGNTYRLDLTPESPEVQILITLLALDHGWSTAAELISLAAITHAQHWTERDIRAYARASAGAVGSGQQGYKLTASMTTEEAERAANWLRSQARDMEVRAQQIATAFAAAHPENPLPKSSPHPVNPV